jgi:arylsulfatase A-like enzyme
MQAFYDGDVATLDAGFGAVLDALRTLGLADDTAVVFVADHGEEFHEHGGFEHGKTLYREVVRVPLVVRVPGPHAPAGRVRGRARQVDVAPTILQLLGVAVPDGLDGEPLLAADGAPVERTRDAFSQARMRRERGRELLGWTTGDTALVLEADRRTVEVFDLRTDPGERRDLAASRPVTAGYGRQTLQRTMAAMPAPPLVTPALDPETERRLQALGYLGRDD